MGKLNLDEVTRAAELWEQGHQLIIDALGLAESAKVLPARETLARLDDITKDIRWLLRDVDPDASSWAPWRTDYPDHEKPRPFPDNPQFSAGDDLLLRCKDIIVRNRKGTFPVHWPTVKEWAGEVRGWFDQLRSNAKGEYTAPMLISKIAKTYGVHPKTIRSWIANPDKAPHRIKREKRGYARVHVKDWQE